MRSRRRRQFAAPVVVTLVASCGPRHTPPASFDGATQWWISRDGDQCEIDDPPGSSGCPADPDATCNPPPPEPVPCEYGPTSTYVYRVDGVCWATNCEGKPGCPDPREVRCPDSFDEPAEESKPPLPRFMYDGKY